METYQNAEIRDWFLPFLLLCMREEELRGHELMGRMADLGFGTVRSGEVYRTLRQAEGEGLIVSQREHHFGYLFSRRRYGLTEPGRAYLEFLVDSLESYRGEIDAFLLAYADRPRDGALG